MDYNLTKKLKDAGLDCLQHSYCNRCEHDSRLGNYHVPTLEELIESCGDEFFMLTKNPKSWDAGNTTGSVICKGSTPEEAVAELWLALNKKEITS